MAFLDGFKKSFTDVSGKAAKKSEEMVKKSGQVVEIQKARLKKSNLETQKKALYADLGKMYFERFAGTEMDQDMAEICDEIVACDEAIEEAAERVAELKGVMVCAGCKAEIAKNVAFCPNCGAEVILPVEEEEEAPVEEEIAEDIIEAETVAEEEAAEEVAEEAAVEEAVEETPAEEAAEEVPAE